MHVWRYGGETGDGVVVGVVARGGGGQEEEGAVVGGAARVVRVRVVDRDRDVGHLEVFGYHFVPFCNPSIFNIYLLA